MANLETIIGIILAGLAVYVSILVAWYIIMAVANWKIFTKAGEAGWKSLIPFLNTYVLFKISWKAKMFWVMIGSLVLGSVLTSIAGENGGFLAILGAVFSLASSVIGLISVHKLSKSFGHGLLFTLGLIFLSPLFTLILGLGKSQYKGPNGGEEMP